MGPPLALQIRPCGPTLDHRTANRAHAELADVAAEAGWRPLLEAAWPALEPMVAASPYIASLMRRNAARLRRVLSAAPEAALADVLTRTEALSPGRRAGGPTHRSGEGVEPPGEPPFPVAETLDELRRLKAELHLITALSDLGGAWDLFQVTAALSAFADASLRTALALAARQEIERGRMRPVQDPADDPVPGFFCLALGKLGAGELNYSSDIDLSLFYDPGLMPTAQGVEPSLLALRLTQGVVEALQARTAEGYVFRTDLRLRPDPSSTPAAVPVDAALDYYERVGQNWERAAMIKARVAAGDRTAGAAFLAELQPFIWRRALDYAAIADIHAIKRQIHVHKVDDRLTARGCNLKLGAGGIREIEFFVQTQQLIFGGRDRRLRASPTLEALAALAAVGLVAPEVKAELTQAYGRLRNLEHRVQMINDEQTHVLPEARAERMRVAVLAGFDDLHAFDGAVSAVLRRVNARYGELFAEDEPLSSQFGSLVFTGVDNDPETLNTLKRLGFSNPEQVSSLIRAWRHGRIAATRTERGRELFTRLAPRLLKALHATGAPDAAFIRFADFFSGLRSGVQVQSLFLAEPRLFRLVVEVMAFAPRLAVTLARQPAALDSLLDPDFFAPFKDEEAPEALAAAWPPSADFEASMDAVRRVHREQAFRIGVRIMSATTDAGAAGRAFTRLADACIRALAAASLNETARIAGALAGRSAVVALGKAGSQEMTATSDLDLMTLYQADGDQALSAVKGWGAETFFARFTQRLVAALSAPTGEGTLYRVDLQLRPSGTAGPVAVSLAAFADYYAEAAETWEFLALTRARVVWASTDAFKATVGAAIETALRRPRDWVRAAADVRTMRALMETERPARGPWDLKLCHGGLVDIEFAAQFLQIAAAAAGGPLRANTGAALEALAETGVGTPGDLLTLAAGWRLQQTLSQILKVALDEGMDPGDEPRRFRTILSKAAGARSYRSLTVELRRAQAQARAAYHRVLRSGPRQGHDRLGP